MTTGESLLVSEQATAPGNELYKPSDRSELANIMSLGARNAALAPDGLKTNLKVGAGRWLLMRPGALEEIKGSGGAFYDDRREFVSE